jgi:hypothetical protein
MCLGCRAKFYLAEKLCFHNCTVVECVFVDAGTFLPSRCLTTVKDSHKDTYWWEEFMNYAVKMGLGTMTNNPHSIKIDSGFQMLIVEDA